MGETTAISWASSTWNPWRGCRKIDVACSRCYMFTEQKRWGHDPRVVVRSTTTFDAPLKWRDPRRIFTCSWSDWFIAQADPWRADAWAIIGATPQHTYMILTKRHERMAAHLPWAGAPWSHVWLGVSIGDRAGLGRLDALRAAPAALRFVSFEPLLEELGAVDLSGIDWAIIGGESGPRARRCDMGWVRALQAQCRAQRVPTFVKQMGAFTVDCLTYGRHDHPFDCERIRWRDPKGATLSEWPEEFRVQQFPDGQRRMTYGR